MATEDTDYVDQTGTKEYMIHEFKDYIATASASFRCIAKSTLAPSSSTVYLQLYNRTTTTWDTIDSDNVASADTDFTLQSSVPDLTNYKDGNNVVSARIYQEAL